VLEYLLTQTASLEELKKAFRPRMDPRWGHFAVECILSIQIMERWWINLPFWPYNVLINNAESRSSLTFQLLLVFFISCHSLIDT
jgi:hypothetical protein